MTAKTNPEHLAGLQRLQLPRNEDSAVGVVIRYFADRGVICTEQARSIMREGTASELGLLGANTYVVSPQCLVKHQVNG
jgi:hypothetical protein